MHFSPLRFESLESRHALTSLAASLQGTTLRIQGTPDDDVFIIDYDTRQLTLVELNQSYPLKGIKAIEISTGTGNDQVQLNFVSPKKAKWLSIPLTIQAQGGDDTLVDTAGNHYYFAAEQTLSFNKKGRGQIDGAKLTWFDSNLADTNLRQQVQAAYADKVLSRADMLSIFSTVAEDDVVAEPEFASLQKIVGNAALFRKLEDVYTLSTYVVSGTIANQYFQQTTLGNLTAGSTGAHLEKLVDKWFYGKDLPDSSDLDTGIPYQYAAVSGTLFVDGASYADIRQGNVGDCYLLAGLGAIAVHSPKTVSNMFIVNGDGTYAIRFYNGKTPYYITVDSQLPVDYAGRLVFASAGAFANNPFNELWVPLVEKAYAQLAEFGWLDTGGEAENSYAAINAGWPGDAMAQVTGKPVEDLLMLSNEKTITKTFSSKRPVTFISTLEPKSSDIVENHVYVMLGYNSRTKEFILFNPWGLSNNSLPAIINFTWSQLQENFYAWDLGPKL